MNMVEYRNGMANFKTALNNAWQGQNKLLQSSAVITWSNMIWYDMENTIAGTEKEYKTDI